MTIALRFFFHLKHISPVSVTSRRESFHLKKKIKRAEKKENREKRKPETLIFKFPLHSKIISWQIFLIEESNFFFTSSCTNILFFAISITTFLGSKATYIRIVTFVLKWSGSFRGQQLCPCSFWATHRNSLKAVWNAEVSPKCTCFILLSLVLSSSFVLSLSGLFVLVPSLWNECYCSHFIICFRGLTAQKDHRCLLRVPNAFLPMRNMTLKPCLYWLPVCEIRTFRAIKSWQPGRDFRNQMGGCSISP